MQLRHTKKLVKPIKLIKNKVGIYVIVVPAPHTTMQNKLNIDGVAILENGFGQFTRQDMVDDDDWITLSPRGGEIAGHTIINQ